MLQKELSEVFLVQTKAMHGVMVTVSQVRVSPDLSTAKVYISIFPNDNNATILKNIQDNAKSIRYELAGRLRFQLRRMPELSYFLDDSIEYAENIDAILNKINPR